MFKLNNMNILQDYNPELTVKNVSQLRDILLSLKFTWDKEGLEMFLEEMQKATSNQFELDLFVQRFFHSDNLYETIGKKAIEQAR